MRASKKILKDAFKAKFQARNLLRQCLLPPICPSGYLFASKNSKKKNSSKNLNVFLFVDSYPKLN